MDVPLLVQLCNLAIRPVTLWVIYIYLPLTSTTKRLSYNSNHTTPIILRGDIAQRSMSNRRHFFPVGVDIDRRPFLPKSGSPYDNVGRWQPPICIIRHRRPIPIPESRRPTQTPPATHYIQDQSKHEDYAGEFFSPSHHCTQVSHACGVLTV